MNISKRILSSLKKEYFSLVRGKTIIVPIVVKKSAEVKISWKEDICASFDYEIRTKDFSIDAEDQIFNNRKMRKMLSLHNAMVKNFVNKTKQIATEHCKENDDEIWEYLWSEQAKAGL